MDPRMKVSDIRVGAKFRYVLNDGDKNVDAIVRIDKFYNRPPYLLDVTIINSYYGEFLAFDRGETRKLCAGWLRPIYPNIRIVSKNEY